MRRRVTMSSDFNVVECVIKLLGGLAVFLYSMRMMSNGLEAAAGNKLKSILAKLTTNRFLGLLVGVIITALIQSSSATTVMVVGFVNAGLMDLFQSLWVIMGANIGTNITSQLIAFDFGAVAPLIAIIGVFVILISKNKKANNIGEIVAGLGFIFVSLNIMSDAMAPFTDSPLFPKAVSTFENPILGILAGMIFVAVIQSSAAGVAVLQAMALASAGANIITIDQAVFLLYGMNIGTCITAMLSSIGTSRMAVKAALMHLTFNVLGCVMMTVITVTLPFTELIRSLSPDSVARQIANAHLIFNVFTTIVMLPLGFLIVKFVNVILPDKETGDTSVKHLEYLVPSMLKSDLHVGTSAAFITSVHNEISRMLVIASENVERSMNAVLNNNEEVQVKVDEAEEYVDYLNKEISYYISHGLSLEMAEEDAVSLSAMFKITGNIERMGDHATNIAGYANMLEDKGYKLSEKACSEVQQMIQITNKATKMLFELQKSELHVQMAKAEQRIDDMTTDFRRNQIERMKTGECSGEACVIYSEMLTDFERLGDHLLNIAEAVSGSDLDVLVSNVGANKKVKEATV